MLGGDPKYTLDTHGYLKHGTQRCVSLPVAARSTHEETLVSSRLCETYYLRVVVVWVCVAMRPGQRIHTFISARFPLELY